MTGPAIHLEIGMETLRSERELDRIMETLQTSPLVEFCRRPEGLATVKQWLREAMWQLKAARIVRTQKRWYLACLLMKTATDKARKVQLLPVDRMGSVRSPIGKEAA